MKEDREVEFCFKGSPRSLTINLFLFFFLSEIILVLLDVFVNHYKWSSFSQIRKLTNLTREDSLGTWVSTVQFLLVGVVCWLISVRRKAENASFFRKTGWLVASIFFIYLSLDDGARVHERIGPAVKHYFVGESWEVRTTLGAKIFYHFPSYSWQVVFAPIFGIICLCMFVLFLKEFKSLWQKIAVAVGFALYGISQFMDYLEGLKEPYSFILKHIDIDSGVFIHFAKVAEEFLEMFATTLILVSVLAFLLQEAQSFMVRFLKD